MQKASAVRRLLSQVAEKLSLNERLLTRAQRRYQASRKRAFIAHNQKVRFQRQADNLRSIHKARDAEKADKEAARAHHRELRNHIRAQVWLGRVKTLTQRVHKLESDQADFKAELERLNTVTIQGNEATGGTAPERLKAVALASAAACASGKRPNFYSQSGALDLDHCITGEHYGERSDCSSWFTSVYKSAGLKDPNGGEYGGTTYTGSLGEHGKVVRLEDAKPGAAVLYGPFPHHHVEMYVGHGKTIGHGSAPVDAGVPDLFGDGDFIVREYV